MVYITVKETTFERLKRYARPFVDVDPDAIINLALDALDRQASISHSTKGARTDSGGWIDPPAHPKDRARIKMAGALSARSRVASDERDLDIINAHADELNEEARDVLGYQVEM